MSSNDKPQAHNWESTTRRSYLVKLAAATGAAGLAGCGGDGGGTTDSPTDSPADDGEDGQTDTTAGDSFSPAFDTFIDGSLWIPPGDAHVNMYNPAQRIHHASRIIFDSFALRNPETGNFGGILLDSWDIGSDTTTLKLKDNDHTWWNGDQVVAQDFVTQFRIEKHLEFPLWNFIDGVSAPDENTVELSMGSQVNPSVFEFTLLPNRLITNRNEFEGILSNLQDGGDKSEMLELQLKGDVVGNSPFKMTNYGEETIDYEIHDGHPISDTLNFPNWHQESYGDNELRRQIRITDKVDFTTGPMSVEAFNQTPDHWLRYSRNSFKGGGHSLTFDYQDDLFRKPAFRKGIAHIIDREQVTLNFPGGKNQVVRRPTGLPGVIADLPQNVWLGEELYNKFTPYEVSEEKATTYLQEAGCTKSGGEWMRPNGDRLSLPCSVPAGWTDWVNATQTYVSQLSDFGIKAEVVTLEASAYWNNMAPNADFVAAATWSSNDVHPAFAFFKQFVPKSEQQSLETVKDSFPESVEVPMPVGDPDGDMQTMETAEKARRLQSAPPDEAETLIKELAWAHNQTLPMIQIREKGGFAGSAIGTKGWDLPDYEPTEQQREGLDQVRRVRPTDDDIALPQTTALVRYGELLAKSEPVGEQPNAG